MTVHLFDLILLPTVSPYLNNIFHEGYFALQKTNSEFSLVGLNQVHHQNNIKGMGCATHSLNTEDESGLARWGLCVHEISLMIGEFEYDDVEEELTSDNTKPHHEDTKSFKQRFHKDVERLNMSITTNPCEFDDLTLINDTNTKFNAQVFEDIQTLSKQGDEQFREFWSKRLLDKVLSKKSPISLNSFNLPGNQNG